MQYANPLTSLNSQQQQAVVCSSKSVLILAGAGTGKTRTIISRISHLLENSSINASRILAVTFTNKAAREMKERLTSAHSEGSRVMVKTFHSFGTYLLRAEVKHTDREPNFQILDDDESSTVIKDILKEKGLPVTSCREVKNWIKLHKQALEEENYYADSAVNQAIFERYTEYLQQINCYDFEDLLIRPVKLLQDKPELAEKYSSRFRFILVDEYQDTNRAQYELLKQLSRDTSSVMVVGDEDQSIYKFRGADINLILNFESDFDDTSVIRLEENYRSTAAILDTANHIIKNNTKRLGKNLFTSGAEGDPIILYDAPNELAEAEMAVSFLSEFHLQNDRTAVLVRTNNQTRAYETVFNKYGIRYKVTGSISFFGREEIKDIVAIAKWLVNPRDSLALNRFINKPARGLGPKGLTRFYSFAGQYDNLYDAILASPASGAKGKALEAFHMLSSLFADKKERLARHTIADTLLYYFDSLGLYSYYSEKDRLEESERIEGIKEFLASLGDLGAGDDDLIGFLDSVSLEPSSAGDQPVSKGITIMTVHNAKGLEFENIFIGGLEEGLFPHINSLNSDDEVEEERRLFYVALTRAKKRLFLSYARHRTLFGKPENARASSFIYELPREKLSLKYLQFSPFTGGAEKEKTLQPGDLVYHKQYGKGKIMSIKTKSRKHLAIIDFFEGSMAELILEYTKLEKVDY